VVALVLLAALALVAGTSGRRPATAPRLLDLRVGNVRPRFAGDRRLLTTVSPNGDGLRDEAVVTFRLDRAAAVTMAAVRTDSIRSYRRKESVIWHASAALSAGAHRLVWRPARSTPDRTYVLRLTVRDAAGRTRVYDDARPTPHAPVEAPVVRVQGIDVGFGRRSYAPGERADVTLTTDAASVRLQAFDYRPTQPGAPRDPRTSGRAMTSPLTLDWRGHRRAPSAVRLVRAGNWPSGVYFLRASDASGDVGYAPFLLRPRTIGEHRVAVVLSTNTWQAYNFRDENGDGWGDSWYVSGRTRAVDLSRPYLDFGVPYRFKDWDLDFVAWLGRTSRSADFLSDDDLERISGDRLAGAYDLIVFPGHEEYVTRAAYDNVVRYRDLGGNLAFLSANNFFWSARREGERLVKGAKWRRLGRPEAGLVGVQYVGGDSGIHQGPYTVTDAEAAPWIFTGTGLHDGSAFGTYGVEIDARSPASPAGTTVLARTAPLLRSGAAAEMTYYELPRGAKVFAAGALNFGGSMADPAVARLVGNVWDRLSQP
jgi:hypothetical protein